MVVGVVKAAKLVGRDRATLWRYVKAGKLSATLDAKGRTQIDTAELMRVFGELQPEQPAQRTTRADGAQHAVTPLATLQEIARLEAENARLQATLTAETAEKARLQGELHDAHQERRTMQDRYMAVIERLSLAAPSTTPTAAPVTSSNGNQASASRRPRTPRQRPAATPQAPTLAEALTSWITGGR